MVNLLEAGVNMPDVRKLLAQLDRWGNRDGPTWHFRNDSLTRAKGGEFVTRNGTEVRNFVRFLRRATGVHRAIPVRLTGSLKPCRLVLRFALCKGFDLFDSVYVRFRLGARTHTIWTHDVGDYECVSAFVAGHITDDNLVEWLENEFGGHTEFNLFLKRNRGASS